MSDPVIHIIDDDAAIRGSLSLLLCAAAMTVRTYDSASAFLDQSADAAPGCIVTDIHMPGIGGLELVHQLTARGVCFPIIAISGDGGVPVAVEAMRMSAVNFLQKPFRQETLIDAIDSALAGVVKPAADRLPKAPLAATPQAIYAMA
jgi:two-component system response regulator FixJ